MPRESSDVLLVRLLKFIRLMSDGMPRTVRQYAQRLGVKEGAVYRYLKNLEAAGYYVDKKPGDRYFLIVPAEREGEFTLEENALLQSMLATVEPNNPLVPALRQKILSRSDQLPILDSLYRQELFQHIEALREAINRNVCVVLRDYASASSQTLRDRRVEPLQFLNNYGTIECCDKDDEAGKVKHFKIVRIGAVELTDERQTLPGTPSAVDDFSTAGSEAFPICLHLSQRAMLMLREEHPATRDRIFAHDDPDYPFRYEGEVYDYLIVGRFVLSLPGHVRIVKDAGLRAYVEREAARGWG